MTYIYKSPIGIFSISRRKNDFALSIGDLLLGTYRDAETAAKAVHTHSTGYEPWDRRTSLDRPADLTRWDTLDRS
jgi:hypothetical protein